MIFLWLFILSVVTIVLVVILLMRYLKEEERHYEEKNSMLKKQMTSNIAHELRTPVTSIRGYLETLISCPDLPQEKKQAFLERAYTQTLRLSELISDMALISKMEEKSSNFAKTEVDLYDVSNEVYFEFEDKIKAKGVTFVNDIYPGTTLMGNKILLYTILRNMVENSLKYAGEGISLHLQSFSPDSGFLTINYYDTGMGVPEEHLERIFERFYRISDGRTRDDGGSGLGLSIVRNAIAFHDGTIKAYNRPEGGLQFIFTLSRK